MQKIFFSILVLSFLIFGFVALAQESDLPSPGLTPDSPFYFLKSWKESIQTFFTFGAENKAKQFLHLAEVRLVEYQKMIEILRQAQDKKASQQIQDKKLEIAEKTFEKYEKQLNQAVEKAQEVQQKEGKIDAIDAIQERKLKHQEVLIGVLEKVPEQAKKGIKNALEIFKKEFEIDPLSTSKENKESEKVCAQVITPAIDPKTNVCKEFPTPCDVPAGWKKVDKCPSVSTPSTSSAPSTSPKPTTSSEPIPTEIRYFTCPDGTKVESGKCYGKGETLSCMIRSGPELQCPTPTPPVAKGGICATAGETKYYQCSDGAKVDWCVCAPESGAVGAKNVWRCQYLPELSCPKPIPAPASQPVACYIQKDCVFVENKDDCLRKGGSPSSESSCPVPAPAPVPLACAVSGIKDYKCPDGTLIKWQCSCGEDSWSCQTNPAIFCPGLKDTTSLIISDIWIRDMFWTEEPPVPNVTQGPGIFHFFWGTSKPAISYVEYGLSDSYGLTTPTPPSSLGIQHTNNAQTELKGNTLYHSRIVATDAQGNTAVSGDFTFSPAFNFTTIPGTVQPYIRLSGPGISPTYWKIGETPSIVWEARGVNKVNIDLVMFDSSGNRLKTYSIAKGVTSSGTAGGSYIYTWKVPSNSEFLQAGYKFKVVISDPANFVFGTNANDLFIQE